MVQLANNNLMLNVEEHTYLMENCPGYCYTLNTRETFWFKKEGKPGVEIKNVPDVMIKKINYYVCQLQAKKEWDFVG